MPTCLDAAKIAYGAYFTRTSQYYESPPGHMVDDWKVQTWETGTLFGNGFQGGIWQSGNDVVVGCCGTNPKQKGKFVSDLSADMRIGFKILPNQSSSARKMVIMAKSIANGRRVSVTGHSLGGALAQVVGVWESVPFITFNAPPMYGAMHLAMANFFKPQMMLRTIKSQKISDSVGVNFIIPGDIVSSEWVDKHVGMVVDLRNKYGQLSKHGKNTCWQAILETDWANIDPFG